MDNNNNMIIINIKYKLPLNITWINLIKLRIINQINIIYNNVYTLILNINDLRNNKLKINNE